MRPRRLPGRPTALVAIAGDVTSASEAVHAGANVIEFRSARPAAISAFRARYPAVPVYLAADGTPGQIRALGEGGPSGHGQPRGGSPGGPPRQPRSGAPAGPVTGDPLPAVLAEVVLCELSTARAAGLGTLVDADAAAAMAAMAATRGAAGLAGMAAAPGPAWPDLAGLLAIIAVAAWLGADAVRTRHLGPARRALDMTASIGGLRPPVLAVRGLA
jgi:hypothetical protein